MSFSAGCTLTIAWGLQEDKGSRRKKTRYEKNLLIFRVFRCRNGVAHRRGALSRTQNNGIPIDNTNQSFYNQTRSRTDAPQRAIQIKLSLRTSDRCHWCGNLLRKCAFIAGDCHVASSEQRQLSSIPLTGNIHPQPCSSSPHKGHSPLRGPRCSSQ